MESVQRYNCVVNDNDVFIQEVSVFLRCRYPSASFVLILFT